MQTLRRRAFDLSAPNRYACVVLCLLILTFLSSCAPKHRVEVEFRDGRVSDYSLVSIRDSAIVVQPTYELTDVRYLAYTHMAVIPSDSIFRIRIPVAADFVSSIPAMLLGSTVGATLGKPCDCEDKLSKAVIGFAIGWNLDKIRLLYSSLTNRWLFLWAPDDRRKIRSESIFPQEPPIMEYVR